MKKKLIVLTVIAACIALCASVWPQDATPERRIHCERPETPVAAHKRENKVILQKGNVKTEPSQLEMPEETASEPNPMPTPVAPEMQPIPEPAETPVAPAVQPIQEPNQTPNPVPEPSSTQTTNDPQPDSMVYVEGFGWLESQGEGVVIHDETIYENGNKVGSMR